MVNVKAFHRKLCGMRYRLGMIISKEDIFSKDSQRAYTLKTTIQKAIESIEKDFPNEGLIQKYPL